jgi:HEPN domain-containing protein
MSRSVVAEHVAAWLRKARRELEAAEWDLSATPPFLDDSVFHSQQAVEKALKGLLTARGVVFTKTHNIAELGVACIGVDASLEALLRRASRLTVYAWRYRYPGGAEEPPESEAREAIAVAHEVLAAVDDILAEESGPRG